MYSVVRSVVLFKEFKMIFLAAILIVSAISIAESIDCDKAENKGHTYCKYQGTSKKHCKDVFVQGMEDKSVPLKLNNYKRLLIANGKTPNQPSAANMCILTWDEESAATAQRWADQCHFGHDNGGAARRTVKYEQCGQNVFRQQSSVKNCTEDWKAALDTFYDEHKVFNTGVKKYVHNADYGHYTQIAWATTSIIGCGFTCYESTRGGSQPFERLYVCNYCDSGNAEGKPVYIEGPAASKCNPGTTPIRGLCQCTP